jgi:pimeloyl-ACP methyl ester carboxylesterase
VTTALPDPALVVLVGASGSGKSAWAAARYRPEEVVSSDHLRSVVGSGEHDLDASADAFALLDHIVAARLRRGLITVVDTLGLDPERRRGQRALARQAGRMPPRSSRGSGAGPRRPRSPGAITAGRPRITSAVTGCSPSAACLRFSSPCPT